MGLPTYPRIEGRTAVNPAAAIASTARRWTRRETLIAAAGSAAGRLDGGRLEHTPAMLPMQVAGKPAVLSVGALASEYGES